MDIKEVVGNGIVAVYTKQNQKIGCYDPNDPEGLLKLLGVNIVKRIEKPDLKKEKDFPYNILNLPK